MPGEATITRRGLGALAGGLVLALRAAPAGAQEPAALGAWVRIGADDTVTLLLSQCEIGQGIATTLPAILADELGADWARVQVAQAPVTEPYKNPRIRFMFTGNSESVQSYSGPLRLAGAQARAMLCAAAAARWGVPAAACETADGRVLHRASNRSLPFGALAEAAAQQPVPASPPLRPAAQLKLIGKAVPRRDIPAKVAGSAVFGLDVRLPGMAYAALRAAPTIGGRLERFAAGSVQGRPGVLAVVPLGDAVAVVAEHYWQARQAAEVLDASFTPGPAIGSAALERLHAEALEKGPFARTSSRGTPPAPAAKRVVRDYASPFQAHATMEPMNCTAAIAPDGSVDIWAPTQGPEVAVLTARGVLGVAAEKVRVHVTYSGGGFGRRLLGDFVAQALLCARAAGRPVQVVWTREQDMQRDFWRPMTLQRIEAALDAQGMPLSLAARLVSATQVKPVGPQLHGPNRDPRVTEGLEDARYGIPAWSLDFHMPELPLPTSVLRTTGFGPNIFALESFIDELAQEARQDPYQYRRRLLARDARALRVLDAAAQRAGWGRPLPAGTARGIAFAEGFDTLIASVVELRVTPAKEVRVLRVVSAVDPGRVFDPGIAAANIEGGVMWGLTSAFHSEVTFADGASEQTNFDGYPLLRLAETPRIETHFLESPEAKLGGLGEVGPIAVLPAFANALAAATGERLRRMPVARAGYSPAGE